MNIEINNHTLEDGLLDTKDFGTLEFMFVWPTGLRIYASETQIQEIIKAIDQELTE